MKAVVKDAYEEVAPTRLRIAELQGTLIALGVNQFL